VGLSSAELGRISAGALLVNGGTIATDADVIVSGIGTVALTGSSVQIGHNVTASGVLSVAATGDVTITAGATPVMVQAGNVVIGTGNLTVKGGTTADAFAAVQATTGDVTVSATGAVSLTSGTLVDSDAWIVAAGNILLKASSCTGCTTRLASITPAPWTDNLVDVGLAANGTITVVLGTNEPPQVVQGFIADTNRNIPVTALSAPPQPLVDTGGARAGAAPTLTDPTGTVGGSAGTFGGSESGSGGTSQGGGSGEGAQGKDSKPAKKANARC